MKLDPGDGPFSKSQLMDIARHYYAPMEYAEARAVSEAEIERIERSTPEWQARKAAHDRALTERGTWVELVDALRVALPAYHVVDRTRTYRLEPAFIVELTRADQKPGADQGVLIGMVSMLAPLYFIGESTGHRSIRHPTGDASQVAATILEREIHTRYPYHRLEHDIALTVVPELQTGDLAYRETTLLDLLMSTDW